MSIQKCLTEYFAGGWWMRCPLRDSPEPAQLKLLRPVQESCNPPPLLCYPKRPRARHRPPRLANSLAPHIAPRRPFRAEVSNLRAVPQLPAELLRLNSPA